jgi:hypothetical protein
MVGLHLSLPYPASLTVDELAAELTEYKASLGESWKDDVAVSSCIAIIIQVIRSNAEFESALTMTPGWSITFRSKDTILGTGADGRGHDYYGKAISISRDICRSLGTYGVPISSFVGGFNTVYRPRSSGSPGSAYHA